MFHRLFGPPETRCPHCGKQDVGWATGAAGGVVNLCVARLLSRMVRRELPVRLRCRSCKSSFQHLHALPRTVVGYHGCHTDIARRLVRGELGIEQWKLSQNIYDWLGEGIYCWEHAPGRAWQWARERHGDAGAVVATEVHLGRCLDLADSLFTKLLRGAYEGIKRLYESLGQTLPKNGGRDFKLRKLDRLIIDELTKTLDARRNRYQTVRCPFEEGEAVYEGALIKTQSHIQIAVRDRTCLRSRVYLVGPKGEYDESVAIG